jgi:hypothetical protein
MNFCVTGAGSRRRRLVEHDEVGIVAHGGRRSAIGVASIRRPKLPRAALKVIKADPCSFVFGARTFDHAGALQVAAGASF